MKLLLIYLLIINALSFLLMLADKFRAQNKMRRTPEAVLLGSAILGGSLGCLAGMYSMRHKTKHIKFTVGVPLILLAQVLLAFLLCK